MKPARRPRSPSPVTHLVVALLVGLHTVPSIGQAQNVVLDRVSCNSCRIVREVVLEFGADSSAQINAPNGLIAALPAGRDRYIGLPRNFLPPIVFNSRGRGSRPLGRKGSGPGEFQGAGASALWRGDSLLVGDAMSGRISVFDPALRYVRSFPLPPFVESLVVLADGLLVGGTSVTHGDTLDPIHVFDGTGKELRTFGKPDHH